MNQEIEHGIAQMEAHAGLMEAEDVWVFVNAIEECAHYIEEMPVADVARLFSIFRDGVPHCEAQETFKILLDGASASTYVGALLQAVPTLERNAPEWLETLLVRLLNGPEHRAEFYRQISGAPTTVRRSIIDALRRREAFSTPHARVALSRLVADDNQE